MSPRAAPMAPEARRRAIVDVVVPLLLANGGECSTKQIAEAAGIAEGTIFRVFADKTELLEAAAAETMAPADGGVELRAALAGHDSLAERLLVLADRMFERSDRVVAVLTALRRQAAGQPHRHDSGRSGPPAFVAAAQERLQAMLTEALEPHRAELAVDPATAATLLRCLVLGSRHPGAGGSDLTSTQVVDVLLNGIRKGSPAC